MFKSFQITITAIPIPFAIKCTNNIIFKYPRMRLPVSVFQKKIKILQKYVAESKYYRGNNKHGEKQVCGKLFITKLGTIIQKSQAEIYPRNLLTMSV